MITNITKREWLFLSLVFFMSGTIPLHGQENVNAGGGEESSLGIQISYTIGAPFYEEFSNPDYIVTPGIQIPHEYVTETGVEYPALDIFVGVYPNPVVDFLNLSFPEFDKEIYTIHLQDISGRILFLDDIKKELTEIDFRSLQPGIYVLSIRNKGLIVKTFKIAKN